MASTNLAYQNEVVKKGMLLPFTRPIRHKSEPKACIFCGKTIHVHKFKGKTVCFSCLQHIPSIFAL